MPFSLPVNVCGQKKIDLVIDSPFQTFTVELLVEFIDYTVQTVVCYAHQ